MASSTSSSPHHPPPLFFNRSPPLMVNEEHEIRRKQIEQQKKLDALKKLHLFKKQLDAVDPQTHSLSFSASEPETIANTTNTINNNQSNNNLVTPITLPPPNMIPKPKPKQTKQSSKQPKQQRQPSKQSKQQPQQSNQQTQSNQQQQQQQYTDTNNSTSSSSSSSSISSTAIVPLGYDFSTSLAQAEIHRSQVRRNKRMGSIGGGSSSGASDLSESDSRQPEIEEYSESACSTNTTNTTTSPPSTTDNIKLLGRKRYTSEDDNPPPLPSSTRTKRNHQQQSQQSQQSPQQSQQSQQSQSQPFEPSQENERRELDSEMMVSGLSKTSPRSSQQQSQQSQPQTQRIYRDGNQGSVYSYVSSASSTSSSNESDPLAVDSQSSFHKRYIQAFARFTEMNKNEDKREHLVCKRDYTIGGKKVNDLEIHDRLRKTYARVVVVQPGLIYIDNLQPKAVFVNCKEVTQPTYICNGDKIQVMDYLFFVEVFTENISSIDFDDQLSDRELEAMLASSSSCSSQPNTPTHQPPPLPPPAPPPTPSSSQLHSNNSATPSTSPYPVTPQSTHKHKKTNTLNNINTNLINSLNNLINIKVGSIVKFQQKQQNQQQQQQQKKNNNNVQEEEEQEVEEEEEEEEEQEKEEEEEKVNLIKKIQAIQIKTPPSTPSQTKSCKSGLEQSNTNTNTKTRNNIVTARQQQNNLNNIKKNNIKTQTNINNNNKKTNHNSISLKSGIFAFLNIYICHQLKDKPHLQEIVIANGGNLIDEVCDLNTFLYIVPNNVMFRHTYSKLYKLRCTFVKEAWIDDNMGQGILKPVGQYIYKPKTLGIYSKVSVFAKDKDQKEWYEKELSFHGATLIDISNIHIDKPLFVLSLEALQPSDIQVNNLSGFTIAKIDWFHECLQKDKYTAPSKNPSLYCYNTPSKSPFRNRKYER